MGTDWNEGSESGASWVEGKLCAGYRGPAWGAGTLGSVACLSFLALFFLPSHLPSPVSLFLSRDRVHVAQVGLELADMDLEFLSLFPLPPKCWVTGMRGPGLP